VLKYRDVMGATDPSKAAEGTIRKLHAKSIGENSVHGSDAAETAAIEITQFFSATKSSVDGYWQRQAIAA